MVYLVSKKEYNYPTVKQITVDKSLDLLKACDRLQLDTETTGLDAHIDKLLTLQLGNAIKNFQIVIDATTIDILIYKEILENTFLIGHNLKFDLQWLYNYGIHPLRIYDTMIVEQFLHLGYPASLELSEEEYKEEHYHYPHHAYHNKYGVYSYKLSYALDAVAMFRINKKIDKTIRGQIIYRGLDEKVILYAAGDVEPLEAIMYKQLEDVKRVPNALRGMQIECEFVASVAYLEWCGIKLDESKWKEKMMRDKHNLDLSLKALDDWFIAFFMEHHVGNIRSPTIKVTRKGSNIPHGATNVQFLPKEKTYQYDEVISLVDSNNNPLVVYNDQYDLFTSNENIGTYRCEINWASSRQVILVAKILGFDVNTIDKKTGKEKESAGFDVLNLQRGVNDEFLRLYLGEGREGDDDYFAGYSGSFKVYTSFGQGHLNAINPYTGRIHTVYRAIGTISGRMSSGSSDSNKSLAKAKGLSAKDVSYPNMQQLPHDAITRACFIAEKGNAFISCDYSAMEARIGADVYNEHKLLDEFLYGSGDTHAVYAKAVYKEELKDIPTSEVKKKRPDLRNEVKSVEFATQFGSDGTAAAKKLGITVEASKALVSNLLNGMTGLKSFKEKGGKFVLAHGYVEMLPDTGHRGYWVHYKKFMRMQKSFTTEFWDKYRTIHKPNKDKVYYQVKTYFKERSKWCDRLTLNMPTQGGGSVCLKVAVNSIYRWIIEHGYWDKILFVNFTHDEINSECPEEIKEEYAKVVKTKMLEAAALFYHKLPIPAEAEISDHWVH
jgi:DNA polymerase I-like protein with 3'-5' exonuclease and polymerase domains|nr:MAG TPA: Prex DNA polymerase [Crassvirales sp.]